MWEIGNKGERRRKRQRGREINKKDREIKNRETKKEEIARRKEGEGEGGSRVTEI